MIVKLHEQARLDIKRGVAFYKDKVIVFSVFDTRMNPDTINSQLDSLS